MAKFYGKVGFSKAKETGPGIVQMISEEREYTGDLIRNNKKVTSTDKVNDNISISNQISIIADQFINDNLFAISYVEWMGSLWKVTDIEVQRPRLLLTLGGVYNGITSESSDSS